MSIWQRVLDKVLGGGVREPRSAGQSSAFAGEPPLPTAGSATRPATTSAPAAAPAQRRVVRAPVLVPDEDRLVWSENVAIRAQVAKDRRSCSLYLDRPVLAGYSAWYSDAAAAPGSPLAEELFRLDEVASLLLHHDSMTLTAFGDLSVADWQRLAGQVGAIVRRRLLGGEPIVAPGYVESIPPEQMIAERLNRVLTEQINVSVAAHDGVITLERVEGNTVYLSMGGRCQGCAAAAITLKEGIYRAFRQAVPQIGAILDVTDHRGGTNPFFDPGAEARRG